jgi:hypothetical protein
MPFHQRVNDPVELPSITASTHQHTRHFLLVAQALLPVLSGHSQEWLCHFPASVGWAELNT